MAFIRRMRFRKFLDLPVKNQFWIEFYKDCKILIRKGGFYTGLVFSSVYFGICLFAMQSYFLRQNLKVSSNIISQ